MAKNPRSLSILCEHQSTRWRFKDVREESQPVGSQGDVARLDGFRGHVNICNDLHKAHMLLDLDIGIRHKLDQNSQEREDEQLGDDKEGKVPLDDGSIQSRLGDGTLIR